MFWAKAPSVTLLLCFFFCLLFTSQKRRFHRQGYGAVFAGSVPSGNALRVPKGPDAAPPRPALPSFAGHGPGYGELPQSHPRTEPCTFQGSAPGLSYTAEIKKKALLLKKTSNNFQIQNNPNSYLWEDINGLKRTVKSSSTQYADPIFHYSIAQFLPRNRASEKCLSCCALCRVPICLTEDLGRVALPPLPQRQSSSRIQAFASCETGLLFSVSSKSMFEKS